MEGRKKTGAYHGPLPQRAVALCPMDPDGLRFRSQDNDPRIREEETSAKRKVPKSRAKSSRTRRIRKKLPGKLCRSRKILEGLKNVQILQSDLSRAIIEGLRQVESQRDNDKKDILKRMLLKKGLEKETRILRLDVAEKTEQIEFLSREVHEFRVTNNLLDLRLSTLMNALREKKLEIARKSLENYTLTNSLREKELEMARKLGEKDLSMEMARKKDEQDKLQMEEAHRLECDALRRQAQQTEDPNALISQALESIQTAVRNFKKELQDIPSNVAKKVSDLPTPAEHTTLAADRGNEELNVTVDLESDPKPQLQQYVIPAAMNLDKEQEGFNMLKGGGEKEASTDVVGPDGNAETTCRRGKRRRKSKTQENMS